VHEINAMLALIGTIGLFGVFSWGIVSVLEKEFEHYVIKRKKLLASITVISVFLISMCIVLPSRTVIYAYAGSQVLEGQLEQMQIDGTMQNDIYKLIQKKIKDELVDDGGEE